MSGLALRTGLCVLALLCALAAFSTGIAVASGLAVPMQSLARCAMWLLALPVTLALWAHWRVKRLGEELSALANGEQVPGVALRFVESAELAASLARLRESSRAKRTDDRVSVPPLSVAQALRVKFLAALGHDLRSPLNAMLGFADLLVLTPSPHWQPAQHKSVAIIQQRARDLLRLIDAMVDWARLSAGELTLELAPVDARELLEEAVAQARERSGGRGLTVDVQLAAALGSVQVDRKRALQALLGLMDHALRSEQPTALAVRAQRVASAQGQELRVEVEDASLAVRAQDRANLFQAFRPSFAPSGQRIAGLSLGTALARALVRAQGGDVWFEGRPEQGTTFVLTLRASDS